MLTGPTVDWPARLVPAGCRSVWLGHRPPSSPGASCVVVPKSGHVGSDAGGEGEYCRLAAGLPGERSRNVRPANTTGNVISKLTASPWTTRFNSWCPAVLSALTGLLDAGRCGPQRRKGSRPRARRSRNDAVPPGRRRRGRNAPPCPAGRRPCTGACTPRSEAANGPGRCSPPVRRSPHRPGQGPAQGRSERVTRGTGRRSPLGRRRPPAPRCSRHPSARPRGPQGTLSPAMAAHSSIVEREMTLSLPDCLKDHEGSPPPPPVLLPVTRRRAVRARHWPRSAS